MVVLERLAGGKRPLQAGRASKNLKAVYRLQKGQYRNYCDVSQANGKAETDNEMDRDEGRARVSVWVMIETRST